MVVHDTTCRYLNVLHSALPPRQKERFCGYFRNIFAESQHQIGTGFWRIKFAGKSLLLPLTADGAWYEWNSALSVLGADLEVKITYANLLHWQRPSVFFDIGANYGLHSLLFLLHGVRTVSFEPNVSCHEYLMRVCKLNQLECEIQATAVSDSEGWAEFCYPDRHTWNGTTDPRVRVGLERRFQRLNIRKVKQMTIDHFVATHGLHPDLIKIDAEGSESQILRGSRETLRSCQPLIIFESWPGTQRRREDIVSVLAAVGYRIFSLPFQPRIRTMPLDNGMFLESTATNFLAQMCGEQGGSDAA